MKIRSILLFVICSIFVTSHAYAEKMSEVDKLYGLSMFWREAKYNFGHWDHVPELDWDAAFRESIPRVLTADNELEYYRELQRFCALLKDGHTNVYLPKSLLVEYIDEPRIALHAIGKKVVVTNIDREYVSQIPVGSQVIALDGEAVEAIIEQRVLPLISTSAPHMYQVIAVEGRWDQGVGLMFGPKDSSVTVSVLRPDGSKVHISMKRDQRSQKVEWAVPPPTRPLYEMRWYGDVAYVALNYFSRDEIVPAFEKLVPELRGAKAVILDLRKNGGGKSKIAASILGHFTDQPITGSAWRSPLHIAVHRAWGRLADVESKYEKHRAAYRGEVYYYGDPVVTEPRMVQEIVAPVYVLISNRTASAAEDFLVMADGLAGWTKIGTPTYGSTGQPLFFDLPGGGRARISTKRDYFPDGREFVGVGIQPDILVPPTIEAFQAGFDAVLSKALEMAQEASALNSP